eukprot:CAMPEP_0197824194 /NCGR_PEP_ID=MMETSP1437-20131217/1492_1 /TAXON_ID=49252 ORGANISM="Eucampia antarctica, Strain CCMP1452" /NCGR_SAMPLE_ID=MMETSP1437 /ASSEMBLY_ACC=CAM_ASM_001096 /LENGTH=212 /DNA_ID=CAMNT_0043423737 /DNA_START=13 /DNA_END=651 /DNA_ORIENTATION=+
MVLSSALARRGVLQVVSSSLRRTAIITPSAYYNVPSSSSSLTSFSFPKTTTTIISRSISSETSTTPPNTNNNDNNNNIDSSSSDDDNDGGYVGVEETIDALDFSKMSNEELSDPSTIPGWGLVHCPPRSMPRGALVGTVVSDKMDKTVNIAVDRYRIVEKYRKRLKYTRKFMAHDEAELCKMGDVVMIVPCQRISKNKHFLVGEIITAKGQL